MSNAMVVVKENISLFMSCICIKRKEGKNALLKLILKNEITLAQVNYFMLVTNDLRNKINKNMGPLSLKLYLQTRSAGLKKYWN